MPSLSPFEHEVAHLLVDVLGLQGIAPESIDPVTPLFGDGLGLDSIDALELSLGLSMRYGVQIESGVSDNKRIFSSLRTLSQHIEHARTK